MILFRGFSALPTPHQPPHGERTPGQPQGHRGLVGGRVRCTQAWATAADLHFFEKLYILELQPPPAPKGLPKSACFELHRPPRRLQDAQPGGCRNPQEPQRSAPDEPHPPLLPRQIHKFKELPPPCGPEHRLPRASAVNREWTRALRDPQPRQLASQPVPYPHDTPLLSSSFTRNLVPRQRGGGGQAEPGAHRTVHLLKPRRCKPV